MLILTVVLMGITMTQLVATTPLSATGAAIGWIVEPLLIGGIAFWLDRGSWGLRRQEERAEPTPT